MLLLALMHFKNIDLELMIAKQIVHTCLQLHTLKTEVSGQRK